MNRKSFAVAVVILLLLCPAVWAQDTFSFSEDLGEEFGFSEDSGEGFGFFETSTLHIGGKAFFEARAILGGDSRKDYFNISKKGDEIFIFPELTLDLGYSGSSSEIMATIKLNNNSLDEYTEDIINELMLRLYAGDFILEAGKMKIVWGKGDEAHVIDSFNANDYTDFIMPDYIDRRLGEPMLRAMWSSAGGLRAELIYAPYMTADRSASSGIWMPSAAAEISAMTQEVLAEQARQAMINNDPAALLAIASKADEIIPSTSSFDYGQAGIRVTHTLGGVDFGVSYYYGHFKQPSANLSGYLTAKSSGNPNDMASDSALPALNYDRLQVLGIEAAKAVGRLNLRAEAAYYLTDDTKGDDPWIKNNSFNWVIGFDTDLPIHHVNLNIQNIGGYIINNDEIGSGSVPVIFDTDYSGTGKYTKNQISLHIKDTFMREKLEVGCTFIWGIEGKDFIVHPEVSYSVIDDLNVSLGGMYITSSKGGSFYDYKDNSFINVAASYRF